MKTIFLLSALLSLAVPDRAAAYSCGTILAQSDALSAKLDEHRSRWEARLPAEYEALKGDHGAAVPGSVLTGIQYTTPVYLDPASARLHTAVGLAGRQAMNAGNGALAASLAAFQDRYSLGGVARAALNSAGLGAKSTVYEQLRILSRSADPAGQGLLPSDFFTELEALRAVIVSCSRR